MAIDDKVRIDTRLAGQLRRYHTWPVIGQQTIAEHTWNLLRIYFCICDKVDPHMVFHITFHDIGEHFTGDIPYPVKRDDHLLKEHMDAAEFRSFAEQMNHWNCFKPTLLNNADRDLFKQIELIEMAEFGMDQINLGNNHGFIIATRCLEAVYKGQPCEKLARYVIKRLALFFEQTHFANRTYEEIEWWQDLSWEKLYANGEPVPSGRNSL
jgi:5'-deoxynucleotidase YfbR-like HD superfamily hydrolase